MKRILIDSNSLEKKLAVIVNDEIDYLDIESKLTPQEHKNDIFLAKIKSIENSLGAVFIEYGATKDGFLSYKDISPHYLDDPTKPIENQIQVGQTLLVQLSKNSRKTKGASFTTFINIVGRHSIVKFYSKVQQFKVSHSIPYEDQKNIKAILHGMDLSQEISIVVRTSIANEALESIKDDILNTIRIWNKIRDNTGASNKVGLVYSSNDILTEAVRDLYDTQVREIVVNDRDDYFKLSNLSRIFDKDVLVVYKNAPLFHTYGILDDYRNAFNRVLYLASGGSIVIEYTEAMTCIDVNSSKNKAHDSIEDTAFFINKEAAIEIVKQLKIRNISGIIVIDFIEINNPEKKIELEEYLIDQLSKDNAIIQIVRLSPLGLVEISRQNIGPSLRDLDNRICTSCNGTGRALTDIAFKSRLLSSITNKAKKAKHRVLHVYISAQDANIINMLEREIHCIELEEQLKIYFYPHQDFKKHKFVTSFTSKKMLDGTRFQHVKHDLNISNKQPIGFDYKTQSKPNMFSAIINFFKQLFFTRRSTIIKSLKKTKKTKIYNSEEFI